MQGEPAIEERPEQPYVGLKAVVSMSDLQSQIPVMTAKLNRWLVANGLTASGKPFLRYHVVDMPKRLEVEAGIPTAAVVDGQGEVQANVLPAGRYAVLVYKDVKTGIQANKRLIDWIKGRGEDAISHASENGEVFEARYETFLTDPASEPDQSEWETEVAIKLRD